MNVTIEVTRADIDAGVRESCRMCPVAIAARRALPQFPYLHVGDIYLCVHGSARSYMLSCLRVMLPGAVCDFIRDFDDDGVVAPFAFSVDVPDVPDVAAGGGR